ncbi:MAG: hypothetical protein M3179_06480, partial [Actinomycetota bacterium]|nr:hypothetical protein [Actinomycetota bacterium]
MRAVLPFRGGAGPPTADGGLVPRRAAVGGVVLEVLVLAADSRGCVGVDLESGAFVRASFGGTSHPSLRQAQPLQAFDLVAARLAPQADQMPDVSRPETVMLDAPPTRTGRITSRRAERYLAGLTHPRRLPLLGFAGRSVPYWTLNGDRPSVTLAGPVVNTQLRSTPNGYECRFTWDGSRHQYPLGDRRLSLELERMGWPRYSPHDLHNYLGYRVRRLLIVLSPPHDGYC